MNRQLSKTTISVLAVVVCVSNLLAVTWTNYSNLEQATCIAVRGDEVWMTTKHGLVMYNKTTGEKTFFEDGLPSPIVERVAVHPQTNDIWIGTYDNGLAVLHNNTWTHFALPDSGALLYDMKIAPDGIVWVATTAALFRFENNTLSTVISQDSMWWMSDPWTIDLSPDGKVLCGGWQPFIFDPSDASIQWIPTSDFVSSCYALNFYPYAIDSNEFYLASDNGIVGKFIDNRLVDSVSLPLVTSTLCMDFDSAGELLVLNGDSTLRKLVNRTWQEVPIGNHELSWFTLAGGEIWGGGGPFIRKLFHLDSQGQATEIDLKLNGLHENHVVNIRRSDDGNVFIVSPRAIQKFDLITGSFSEILLPAEYSDALDAVELNGKLYVATWASNLLEYSAAHGWRELGNGILPGGGVSHLDKDAQGNLWMSYVYSWVAKYDGTGFTLFKNLPGYIGAIHCDTTRNIVWSTIRNYPANDYSIIKIENDSLTFIDNPVPLAVEFCGTIKEDAVHNIWFETNSDVLLKYDGTSFSTMPLPLNHHAVQDVEFLDSTVYVACEPGLWKFENGVWDTFTTSNSPLIDSDITSLYADKEGKLWIGHLSHGMDVYVNKEGSVTGVPLTDELHAVAFPNPSDGKFVLQWKEKENADVRIYSIEGKLILQLLNIQSGNVLDLTGETPGIYFADVKGEKVAGQIKLLVR